MRCKALKYLSFARSDLWNTDCIPSEAVRNMQMLEGLQQQLQEASVQRSRAEDYAAGIKVSASASSYKDNHAILSL